MVPRYGQAMKEKGTTFETHRPSNGNMGLYGLEERNPMSSTLGYLSRLVVGVVMVATILILAGCGGSTTAPPPGPALRQTPILSGQVITKVSPTGNIDDVNRRHSTTVIAQIPNTSIYLLAVPAGKTEDDEAAEQRGDLEVTYSEPNFLLTTPETDQGGQAFLDPSGAAFVQGSQPSRYYSQAAYVRTNANQAQSISTGQGVIVAIVDSGISPSHPALAGRISPAGFDFLDKDADPTEPVAGPTAGHGTFIAGIISLIAPDATILPLRAMDVTGHGNAFAITQAIRYAVEQGAKVINLSLGMVDKSDAIEDAIEYAITNNVVVVVSAGNKNRREPPQFPASESKVAAVAAVDDSDVKAGFSNFGSYVAVSAPGVDLYSAFPGDTFATWSGTSFAASVVAGQAALLLSVQPALSPGAAIQKIRDASVNIDFLNPAFQGQLGKGRIDVRASLN